jgi:hypothetical protein
MNLTRAIKNATNIVKESGDPSRDATFELQGQMEDAVTIVKGQVIKVSRDHREHPCLPRSNRYKRKGHRRSPGQSQQQCKRRTGSCQKAAFLVQQNLIIPG